MTSSFIKSMPGRALTTACASALVVAGAAVSAASSPASAAQERDPATTVKITSFVVNTADNNYPVKPGGTYTETCEMNDPIFGLDVAIKGRHTHKHAPYSFKATYNGKVVAAYEEHWSKDGTQKALYDADGNIPDYGLSESGTLTATFYINHHKVAREHINLVVPKTC